MSIYWHPAMYAEKKDGSGYMKIPTNGHKFYYKNAGEGEPREPFEFPHVRLCGSPFSFLDFKLTVLIHAGLPYGRR